jgi:hypothetical protein
MFHSRVAEWNNYDRVFRQSKYRPAALNEKLTRLVVIKRTLLSRPEADGSTPTITPIGRMTPTAKGYVDRTEFLWASSCARIPKHRARNAMLRLRSANVRDMIEPSQREPLEDSEELGSMHAGVKCLT